MKIRKKFLSFIAVALAVLIQAASLPAMRVAAEDTGSQTVTDNSPFSKISYTLTDQDGNPLPSDPEHPLAKDAAANIEFNFTLRDDLSDQSVPPDYSFVIPKQLKIASDITMYLPNGANAETAYAQVTIHPGADADGDSAGTIHFLDPIKNESNISGSFVIHSGFNMEEIQNTWPVVIPFSLNGVSDPVTLYFDLPAPQISKSGKFTMDASGNPVVTWHVAINDASPATTVRNGVLTDTINPSGGQTYVPGSFQLYTDASYSTKSGTQPTAAQVTEPTAANGYQLTYTLDSNVSQTVYAAYQTTVDTAHLNSTVSNTANLGYTDNDGGTSTVQTSSKVDTPVSYITKDAAYDSTSGEIVYTITLNPNAYALTNVQVSDKLPAGLTLDAVTLSPTGNASDAHTVSQTVSDETPYYTYDATTRQFIYFAHDTLNGVGPQTLYLRAKLPADYFQHNSSANYANTAVISGGGVYGNNGQAQASSGNPAPGSTVISKAPDTKQSSLTNQIITWNVTVGSAKADLPHAIFRDVINPSMTPSTPGYQSGESLYQTYVPGSIKIYSDSGHTTAVALNPEKLQEPSAENGYTLQYDFGDMPAGTQYYITYQVSIPDSMAAGNTALSFPDLAALTPGDGIAPSTANSTYSVPSKVLQKKGISYDYNTRTAKWEIDVNQSQVSLTGNTALADGSTLAGVLVSDDLSGAGLKEFTLNADSITVNSVVWTRQTVGLHTDTQGNALPDAGRFSYDDKTGKLWLNLGQLNSDTLTDRTQTIQFTMTLPDNASIDNLFGGADSNPQVTVKNTAVLYDTQNSGITSTGSLNISNTLAGKTAQYTSGKDYIDWAVPINQNGIDMQGFSIQDTLQAGLQLDTSSVTLYSATRNASTGALTAGDEVNLAGTVIQYDATTGSFGYSVPESTAIQAPYILKFRTYVDSAHSNSTFTNSLTFQSNNTQWHSATVSQKVYYNSTDGTISGQTGSITVTKRDAVTNKALQGATFELLDSYGNVIRSPIVTDSNGQVAFSKLRFAPIAYTLREVTAPDGYQKGADYTFQIPNAAGQTDVQYSYPDQPLTASVQITKADSQTNALLDGAVFALAGTDVAGQPVNLTATTTHGVATFSGVPVGNYTVSEQKAPDGYARNSQTIPVTITDTDSEADTYYTQVQQFRMTDDKLGTVTVDKTDSQTGHPLAGAQFELTDASGQPVKDADGNTVEAQTTDANGQIVFGNLPVDQQNGTVYQVKEVAAPEGYTIDAPDPVTVTLTAQAPGSVQHFTDTHQPGTVRVQKTDENGNPLANATFALTDSSGKTVFTATSGSDGYATFPSVPLGSYTLKETAAPSGYLISSQQFAVQVTDDNYQEAQLFQFVDFPIVLIPDNETPLGNLPTTQIPDTGIPTAGQPDEIVANPKTGSRKAGQPLLWLGFACAAGAAAAAAFIRRRRHSA